MRISILLCNSIRIYVFKYSPSLGDQLHQWSLFHAGLDYNVVSVFGSQSTGKSSLYLLYLLCIFIYVFKGTLLNRLFGTTFDVMNEAQRRQTTKGYLLLFNLIIFIC